MARRVLDLSELSWQLGKVERQPFGPAPLDDRALVRGWHPAHVPGDVRSDLITLGQIPPVETPDGLAAGSWVDDYDWWYRTDLPSGIWMSGDQIVLEADGIDYYSAIWLDGDLLQTHAGMFARQTVRLTPRTDQAGSHELAIRIWGNGALPGSSLPRRLWGRLLDLASPGLEHGSNRMAVSKAQFSFGWDFAPRLLSCGIWDDLRVVQARAAYIEDLWVTGEPLEDVADPTPVRWRLRLRVARSDGRPVRVEVIIAPENFAVAGYETGSRILELCSADHYPCTAVYDIEMEMARARRWWPWDQGEPCLYRATVVLSDDVGPLDEISVVAGARSVRRAHLPEGAPWRFVLNGRALFLRGANWVPADLLPGRVTSEDYARLLEQARAAGVNFLRVWGGGVREKRAFWDICDRLGLMAWQEFPLACDFFDRYPNRPAYLQVLETEGAGIIAGLRGHASLIAWCGGNELSTAREAHALSLLARLVEEHDGTRPWIPASPSEGDLHEWNVWHGYVPWHDLAGVTAPFMSEFGLQAPPVAETLAEMFSGGPPATWLDRRWVARKAQVDKLLHYTGMGASSIEESTGIMQRVQATALQVGLEACRLRRDTCGGVAFWQFDEPWPAVSWSVIDRAGRPKAAYAMLKRSFQPLLVAARFPWQRYQEGDIFVASLWLANDGSAAQDSCRLEADLDDRCVFRQDGVTVAPHAVVQVGAFEVRLAARPRRLVLSLWGPDGDPDGPDTPGRLLAGNEYDLAVPLPGRRPVHARLNRWLASRLLRTG